MKKSNSINFKRFKNKTLTLLHAYMSNNNILLQRIKLNKLQLRLIRDNISLLINEDKIIKLNTTSVYCLVKLNDKLIASGGADLVINIINLSNNKIVKTFIGHNKSVKSIIKINEKLIASGGLDTTLKIWNTEYDQCIYSHIRQYGVNLLLKVSDTKLLIKEEYSSHLTP